ncbi:MAG: hypothetical protein K0R34_1364 [Herbinix sp.]|jgi:hypothetical protein|nr:hypothetical protein [Herbinix sp.]
MNRKTLPNQKTIRSHKKEKYYGTFMTIGCNELSKAMNELSGTEFKVWMYLMKNQVGGTWVLYMVDCCNFTGVCDKSYYQAINALLEKGYLRNEGSSTYGAYDIPINNDSIDNEILEEKTGIEEETLEESSSILEGTLEETTRQLSDKKFLDIPEKSSRENNTNNNKKEQYNKVANAPVDASLVSSANAYGYIENDDTETWIKYRLSIPEIKKLPIEEQGYNNGYYIETAEEIRNAVLKGLKKTDQHRDGVSNSEIFTNPLDYGLVINKLMWDSSFLRKKKDYSEKGSLAYHIGIVLNQLRDGNLKAEREKLKHENINFREAR